MMRPNMTEPRCLIEVEGRRRLFPDRVAAIGKWFRQGEPVEPHISSQKNPGSRGLAVGVSRDPKSMQTILRWILRFKS